MKTYFTFLERNKLFTFVNVAGLSISLMFVFLIADMVMRQLTVDADTKDVDHTYLFASEEYFGAHYVLGERLANRYPEIEDWCVSTNCAGIGDEYADVDGRKYDVKVLVAKDNFFTFFGFPLLEGNPAQVLCDDYSVVLSRSAANRIFGKENALGKSIRMNFTDGHVYTVTGIMEDIGNSIFPSETEMVFPFETMKYINTAAAIENTGMQNFGGANLFIHVPEGVDPNAKNADMLAWLKTFAWPYLYGTYSKACWVPMRDVYFSEMECTNMNQYSRRVMTVMAVAGLLVLLMAVCNYVSMSVAQTSYRAKEMATRRLLGSTPNCIFLRMMLESLVMIVVAFVAAFLLAVLAEPYVMEQLKTRLDIVGDLTPETAFWYVVGIVLISAVSGFVPATILSRYNPMDVVKGTFRRKTKTVYLRLLYVVQCGLTTALLSCALYLGVQFFRILDEPLGYSYGHVLCFPNMSETKNLARFRDEARRLPFVKNVCFTRGFPVDGGNSSLSEFNVKGRSAPIDFRLFVADSSFLSIFHIPLEKDYGLSPSPSSYYLSRRAYKELALDDSASSVMNAEGSWKLNIAGRIPDFQLRSALEKPCPILLQIFPSDSIAYPWDVLIETYDGDLEAHKKRLDALYSEMIDGVPFESRWYDDLLLDSYSDIIRVGKVIGVFTFAALLISLLGLTAMSVYFIAQRKRDMAIRKVFGSSPLSEQSRLMHFSFSTALVSLIIAIPLMWFGIMQIDKIVTFKSCFPWWVPVAAFLTISFISLVAVWLIGRSATRENPVNNLKTE